MHANPKSNNKRNNSLIDIWSFVHLLTSAALAYIYTPFIALCMTFAWEPLEIFVISPIAGKFGILFGHEGWINIVSDLAFNSLGVGLAALFLL
ncbi:TPA: hypothetical protein EYO12_01130 [Candidatus Saccharibacteria bacterium]|nr:hypothetical protein [Candidatus Saccharibacteria bacterium]HIO87321.1 hypothetical protein [Candidatus Saccharibacteria bacterium]